MKYVATFSIMLGILTMLTIHSQLGEPVYAAAHTSGYNHGCSDAQISNPSDRYINQPEKGSSFHSDAFMQAYNEGFDACSGDSNSDSNNNDNSDHSSSDSNSNNNDNSDHSSGTGSGSHPGLVSNLCTTINHHRTAATLLGGALGLGAGTTSLAEGLCSLNGR
jgi:hypothetical protein